MTTKDFSETYAQNLYNLASELELVDAVDEDLKEISATIVNSIDLRETLNDPAVNADAKRTITAELFSGHISEAVAIGSAAIERGGIEAFFALQRAYARMVEDNRKPTSIEIDGQTVEGTPIVAEVVTASKLDEAGRAAVEKKLASALKAPVILREKVDPKIIGGIRISVGDRVLDGTIASQLEAVRETLSNTLQGGEA